MEWPKCTNCGRTQLGPICTESLRYPLSVICGDELRSHSLLGIARGGEMASPEKNFMKKVCHSDAHKFQSP